MKNILIFLFFASFYFNIYSQVNAPFPERIFGGRINAITIQPFASDSSRIFVTCESANSGFYANVIGSTNTFREFHIIPGLSKERNYGGNIKMIEADSLSGHLFFIHQSGLLRTHPSSPAVFTIFSGNVSSFKIYKGHLFFIESSRFHFGAINSSGVFSESPYSPLTVSAFAMNRIVINPITEMVYIANLGMSPTLLISSVRYDSFNSSTTFASLSLAGLTSGVNWSAFAIAPDQRLCFAGILGDDIYFAYNDGVPLWTSYNTLKKGVGGNNFAFAGDSALYTVYFSKYYHQNKGTSSVSTWLDVGHSGMETHPNDGAIAVDPKNQNIIYFTTDLGLGASINGGANSFDFVEGILAIEINDFDLTQNKRNGWAASKSGVLKVSDFNNPSKKWSTAIWPNYDGSPYHSIGIKGNDTNVCYTGNIRIYKTTDNGTTWDLKFTAENPPYNFSSTMSRIEAIEVNPLDENIVFAGYFIEGDDKGGLFYSHNDGATWNQILLQATSGYQDVDIMDIAFNKEGSDTIAYVGVKFNPTGGSSLYRLTKRGSSWSVAKDMDAAHTIGGYEYVVSINDIYVSSTGDTILACGTDAGTNHPVAYYKIISGSNKWTPFTTSGFPFISGKQGNSITLGFDTTFCAVDHEIYAITPGATSWWNYYSYTEGAKINFLYYDALLAGTGTGMDNFDNYRATSLSEKETAKLKNFNLFQNYPNPFNPSTIIKFELPNNGNVKLTVYNLIGQKIITLVDDYLQAGEYSVKFEANNLSAGIYLSVLEFDNVKLTKKLTLLK